MIDGDQINGAAVETMRSMIRYDSTAVRHALLEDCPFDLYWFDKTKPSGNESCGLMTEYDEDGELRLCFNTMEVQGREDVAMVFRFPVSENYGNDLYTADQAKLARVIPAAEKARDIVSENEGRTTDYDKLVAYKEAICELVSYNHEAAGDSSTPYGDPWQLVYVFDGDPSTNVVCEGYSKAFQYLCDLTEFKGSVQCYQVTGEIWTTDPAEAGGHMWNLVNMNNGISYLVDVTNCDVGSIGSPDKLFMKGVTLTSDSAYFVDCGDQSYADPLHYEYDEDTLSMWSKDLLKPSEEDYSLAAETVTELSVEQQPEKTEYCHGDVFDPEGLIVRAKYQNGQTAAIEDYEVIYQGVEDQRCFKKGDTRIDICFGGLTAEIPVSIKAKDLILSGLQPQDREYEKGNKSVSLENGVLEGVLEGEDVSFEVLECTMETEDAGQEKPVTVTVILTGEDASCYALKPIEGLTVNIARRQLSAEDFSIENPYYNSHEIQVPVHSALERGADYEMSGTVSLTEVQEEDQTVVFTGIGNYQGEVTLSWNLRKNSMKDSVAIALTDAEPLVYDGKAKQPEVRLTENEIVLLPGVDYDLRYENNINAGENARVVATGKGDFEGKVSLSFAIRPAPMEEVIVSLAEEDPVYNGMQICPKIDAAYEDLQLAENTDYRLAYGENLNAGEGSVQLEAVAGGNYTGSKVLTFTIRPVALEGAETVLSQKIFLYDGQEKKPQPAVKLGETELKEGTDYEVSYEGNTEVGEAKTIIEGIGNYKGIIEKAFAIRSFDDVTVTLSLSEEMVYDLTDHRPTVSVELDGLPVGEDAYTIEYPTAVYPGQYTVTIQPTAGGETKTAVFTVVAREWTMPVKDEITEGWATLPAAVHRIEESAFAGTAYEVLDLSTTECTHIGAGAFAGMNRLKAVILPETLIYLSEDAFGDGTGGEQPCTICFPKGINRLLSFTSEEGEPEGNAVSRLRKWGLSEGSIYRYPLKNHTTKQKGSHRAVLLL